MDQYMERQVGNIVGIIELHQGGHSVDVFRTLCLQIRMLGQIAHRIQQGNGILIIVPCSQRLCLLQNPLSFLLCLCGSADGFIQLHLLLFIFDLLQLNGIGNRTDQESDHQDQADAHNNGRQVDLFEDLCLGLSSSAAGSVGILRLFPQLLVQNRCKIKIKELGEDIGSFQLGELDLGQCDFRHLDALPGFLGALLFGHIVFLGILQIICLFVKGFLVVFLGFLHFLFFVCHVFVHGSLFGLFFLKIRFLREFVCFLFDGFVRPFFFRLILLLSDFLLLAHIQEIIQVQIVLQIKLLIRCGRGGLLLAGQAQFLIGERIRVSIFIILFAAQESLGIEAVLFIKIKIDIKIVLSHLYIPTFYGIVNSILSSQKGKSKNNWRYCEKKPESFLGSLQRNDKKMVFFRKNAIPANFSGWH